VWDTGVPFPYGGWHHLAIVKETANARLYIDGVLRASRGSTLPLPAQTNRFDIGRSASGEFWLGGIDEVRVWEGVRSAGQIASNQNTRVVAIQPGLLALWRFDEGSGATAFDTSPRALHGTLVDGPAREQSAVLFAHYVTTEDTPFPDVLQAIDPDAIAAECGAPAIDDVNLREQVRFTAGGDAFYVLHPDRYKGDDRTGSAIRSAVVLNQLGYVSVALDLLKNALLPPDQIEALLRATAPVDIKPWWKRALRNNLPPSAYNALRRLRRRLRTGA
jgi:hypothetical protein